MIWWIIGISALLMLVLAYFLCTVINVVTEVERELKDW